MKQYTISLIITDEDNSEQLVQLRAPHLTGKQITDLTTMTLSGVLQEPEPPIMTLENVKKPKMPKHKQGFFGRAPKPEDVEDI